YDRQEVAIGNGTNLGISLAASGQAGEEVVVVGYGTQKKKDVTASISTISADKIRNVPVQSFDQALTGKAAGLSVTLPNGVLNNPPVIRIRGVNSINGSSFPLVVVDGVPVATGDFSSNLSANNALGNINPSDIEDIQVLKDAAAAAIYGSRAANGVLLITTKKGKQGKAKITYDAWVGWTKPFNLFEVLNARDYVELKNEAIRNANYAIPGSALVPGSGLTPPPAGSPLYFLDTINGSIVDTDWTDYIYQTGFQHSHNISVSGANAGTRYFFSANYTKQEGILQTNTFDRKQIRMNLEQRVNNWLKIGGNFNFSRGSTQSPSSGSLPGTPFNTAGSARLAFLTAPNISPYLPNGGYNYVGVNDITVRNNFNQIGRNKNYDRSGLHNPVMVRDLNIITSQSDQIVSDVNAEVKIYKGLTYRVKYGVTYLTVDDRTFYNALHGDGMQTVATNDDGTAFNNIGKYNTTTFQNTLSYATTVKNDHNLNLLVGSEELQNKSDRWGAKRSGLGDNFYNEFQGNFTLNDNPAAGTNVITENYLLSFFGSANYNYKNKYYLSANLRRDGYSAFAQGKKWGTFWGVSGGWNISDEKFFEGSLSKVFDNLRLRASYGTVGNLSAVGNFASLSTFASGVYGNGYPTLFFSQAGNPELTWETSNKKDVGINFSILKNRISGEIGYYRTDLSDLIIDVPTPPSMGIPNNIIQANAASMYNQGLELSLTARVIEKNNFAWSTTLNLTTMKNEVTALASGVPEIIGTTQLERTNITRVGEPIGSFFLIRTAGVDAATGRRIFIDNQGREILFNFGEPVATRYRLRDGTVVSAIDLSRDGYVAGNPHPKVFGGFINNINIMDFDFNIDMFYSFGNKVYYGSRAGMLDQRYWNNLTEAKNRWQKPGDVTDIPRLMYNDNISNGSAAPIDANLFTGNFIKCRNISLGYTLNKTMLDKIKLASVRVYAQMQNAFTITKYPGSDPEISVNGNTALTPGVDRNTIGQARTLTFGINVTF
ncbi:MAG: SusC/RagA family TonB-linked outer membrane protein, partial [Dinghuibacter sp.]|nr:SusC/RagA family TonB-linked outer membrane protein [Dinghuibacter sp.]